jgi:CTP:molybdopterin cytidylyltransferase MocA
VIAGVVLAAGAATRFGGPKQRLLLPEVLARVRLGGINEIVVVAGAHALEATDALVVHCAEWERGPGASLRCGLAVLPPEAGAALVVLADGPDLDPRAVERVCSAWHGEPLVAATYGGVRLHPVLVARELWGRIPDEGARALPATEIPCDDLDPPGDVDFADEMPERLKPPDVES